MYHDFVEELRSLKFENVFNPYANRCKLHDRKDAPKRRSEVLSCILRKAEQVEIDAIWIGRDLGYRGGRRTGLALTDDVHVASHLQRWGLPAERSTTGDVVAERTASIVWELLSRIESAIFLWNVFPFHPYEVGNQFSNRSHNSKERVAGEELLSLLIGLLQPRRIIAIGNDAAGAADRLGLSVPVFQVRHPSYGGQTQFLTQVSSLYGLKSRQREISL